MADEKLQKMELRKGYRNVWHSDLMSTIRVDTPYCCFAAWCAPCASFMLRKRALYNDLSRYTCCGGFMPCSGKCGESKCPFFCLCTEVVLCFPNSVASTRFMLQDEFNIQTTKCDNCIIYTPSILSNNIDKVRAQICNMEALPKKYCPIEGRGPSGFFPQKRLLGEKNDGFMLCINQLACICSLIACILGSDELSEAAQILSCLSDCVYCTVCACMQTQHKIEMDKRDGQFGPAPVMAAPRTQQMSRIDQPVPPPIAYYPQHPPPPAPYGHHQPPPYGHLPPPHYGYPPPPHGYSYPPAGYPPQGYPPPQGHGYPPNLPPPPTPAKGQ